MLLPRVTGQVRRAFPRITETPVFNPKVSLVYGALLAAALWLLARFAGDPAAAVFGAHAIWLIGMLWFVHLVSAMEDAGRGQLAGVVPTPLAGIATAAGLWIGLVSAFPWLAAVLYLLTQYFLLLLTMWQVRQFLQRQFPDRPGIGGIAGGIGARVVAQCAALAVAGVLLGIGLRGVLD